MVRRTWTAVVAVVALGATAACSGEAAEDPAPPPPYDTPAEVVWQQPLDVIGQPVVADGVALVHSSKDKKLRLHAFDVATGEELWTAPVSPGRVTMATTIEPAVVRQGKRTWAAYLRPLARDRGTYETDLEIADLRTGQVVAEVKERYFTSQPTPCDDGVDLCISDVHPRSGKDRDYRFRIAENEMVRQPASPPDTRPLGDSGLSVSFDSGSEGLVRMVDGEPAWRLRLTEAFPEGSTTRHGWAFHLREEGKVIVGSVSGGYEDDLEDVSARHRLSRRGMAGIDTISGAVRWRAKGSRCLDDGFDKVLEDVDVRCHDTGVGRRKDWDGPWRWTEVHSVVEGFAASTGRTTWSLDLGTGAKKPLEARDVVHAGPGSVVVTPQTGPTVLDLREGSRRVPVEGEVFACREEKAFQYLWAESDDTSDLGYGTGVVQPCDATGKPVTDPLGHHAVDAVSQRSGDLRLVSVEGALVAYTAEPTAPAKGS